MHLESPHPDEPSLTGQPTTRILGALLLASTLPIVGCEPGVAPPDGGATDSGAIADGGGGDAGPMTDGGGMSDGGAGLDAGDAPPCRLATGADPTGTDAVDDALGRATVTIDERDACLRTYTMTTTATLRDGEPDNPRTVEELDGWPTVRTGHDMFDALHALALEEVRENSVSFVRDYAFNDGSATDCGEGGCFETGRLWNYVWTRDTAYSVDLGLAALDPVRARNSLEFKLSERRGGGDLQIVQDTGSGGSYPVSSDRVAWAVGAARLLEYLHGDARDAFRGRALEALRNTVEHDRRVVYDPRDGLYRGEQSFLDWREQTYPDWTEGDVVHIGMSKALSTNLLHLRALELTAALIEETGGDASRYEGFADGLRQAIRDRFWMEDEGLFSTYVTTELDQAPVRRYDLLGSAFAVLFGVASDAQAARVLRSYPHYGRGAPVVWPQQQLTPIYHNRGEWPFVSAYWLRAAAEAGNDAVVDRMVDTLLVGAALNLSNMENFDAGTGAPWVDEGDTSGPVVNSQRQLWSVAAYASMVHQTIFGVSADADGLRVRPTITAGMRSGLFAGTDTLVLNHFPFRDGRVTVVVHLPEGAGAGVLAVSSVTLDGATVATDAALDVAAGDHTVEVTLASGAGPAETLELRDDTDYRQVFGPRTPRITAADEVSGQVRLTLDRGGEAAADVTWRIYRDGSVIADELDGATTVFTDPDHDATSAAAVCYTAELTFVTGGNHSQHASPFCFWGGGIVTVDASSMDHIGGSDSTSHGRFHYEPWGDPGHSLSVPSFTATQSGMHLFQVTFGNGAGSVSSGITCGIKRLVVEDTASGATVGEGVLIMPHLGDWSRWEDSSFVSADLEAGRTYRIVIRGDEDVSNMSAFEHFEAYTAGTGGASGPFFRVNIAELKIFPGR